MPRSPLLPILRIAAALAVGSVLFYCPKRRHPSREVDVFWATDINEVGPGPLQVGLKATTPLPGQKRPPCTPRVERELVGACWQPHLERPPCPPGLYEGQGMCLQPVKVAERPPTSIHP